MSSQFMPTTQETCHKKFVGATMEMEVAGCE
jgi:hypothetical protein